MGIVRQIKNVTGGYSSSQVKVRDVTSNNENTPSRSQMQDIAELTFDGHEVVLIMDVLDKRLNDRGKYWRHVLKALVLLDYLLRFGSDSVVLWCRENLYIVKTLREYHHTDDSGHDVGHPIRARARELTDIVSNNERLEEERGRRRRPRRYRSDSDADRAPRTPRRNTIGSDADDDEELRRALELSKETAAEEEERRRMGVARTASQEDLTRAMALSQQNDAALMAGQSYDPFAAQAFAQQQALAQQQAQAEAAALAQAQQQYLAAQQQAQAEQQRLYEMQQAQQAQQAQLAQYQFEQQQLAAQQAAQQQQQPLQPLKTGSNNPFAAFNQQQQHQKQQQQLQESPPRPSLGRRQSLHRQSTFDREHMDRLDQILSLDAPMDTFGNTGASMIPAQHTHGEFVDSSGRGLTAMLTKRKTGTGSNPFAPSQGQQYTGIATTQMHPEHTGFGFGNANGSRSSTNLIDL